MININMRCIEMSYGGDTSGVTIPININMRCIEMVAADGTLITRM